MLGLALHTLLRTAAFVGIYAFYRTVVLFPDDDGLGTGLLAFTTFAAVSLVWGAADGWFSTAPRLIGTWVAVGVVFAAVLPVLVQVPGDVDPGLVLSDLLSGLSLTFGLVAVPAIAAGAVVAALREALRPPRSAPLR